jgi:hypothetical protein
MFITVFGGEDTLSSSKLPECRAEHLQARINDTVRTKTKLLLVDGNGTV